MGVIAVVALALLFGRTLLELVIVPQLDGYLSAPPAGVFTALEWPVLLQGDMPMDGPMVVPPRVRALDGQPVTVRGFCLPLHQGKSSAEFFLAPKPSGCYFCNPPGVSEVILITTADRRKVEMARRPIEVFGILRVATDAQSAQSLYAIDQAVLLMRR